MSYLDDAVAEYRFALSLSQKGGLGTSSPIEYIKENLGYCILLKKRYRQGIAIILEALQISLANGTRAAWPNATRPQLRYMQLKEFKRPRARRSHGHRRREGFTRTSSRTATTCSARSSVDGERGHDDHISASWQELYPHLATLKTSCVRSTSATSST